MARIRNCDWPSGSESGMLADMSLLPVSLLAKIVRWLGRSLPDVTHAPETLRRPGRKLVMHGRIVHIDNR